MAIDPQDALVVGVDFVTLSGRAVVVRVHVPGGQGR
jgi:L-ribulokinase